MSSRRFGSKPNGTEKVLTPKSKKRPRYSLLNEHNTALGKAESNVYTEMHEKLQELDKSTLKGGDLEGISLSGYKRKIRSLDRETNRKLAEVKLKVDRENPVPDIQNPHMRFHDEAMEQLIISIFQGKSNREAYKILLEKNIEQERYDAYEKKKLEGSDVIDKEFIDIAKDRYPASWINLTKPILLSGIGTELKTSGLYPQYSHDYYCKGKVSRVLSKLSCLYKAVKALKDNRTLIASNKKKESIISELKLKVIQVESKIKDPNGWHEIIEHGLKEDKARKIVIEQVLSSYDVDEQVVKDRWKNRKKMWRKVKV